MPTRPLAPWLRYALGLILLALAALVITEGLGLLRRPLDCYSTLQNLPPARLLFVDEQGIGVMTPQGAARCPIVNGAYTQARFSGDGKRLAYYEPQASHLWVSLANGTERLLVSDTVNHRSLPPAWSPDGRLAYAAVGANNIHQLFIWSQNEAALPLPNSDDALEALWSPDGAWIAYVVFSSEDGSQGELRLISPDGTEGLALAQDVRLRGVAQYLVWSPDATRLAYTAGERVVLRSVPDGQLVASFSLPNTLWTSLAWSPDGAQLALRGSQDGTSLVALAQLGTDAPRVVLRGQAGDALAWALDSTAIYYTDRPDPDQALQLYRWPLVGGEVTPLGAAAEVALSGPNN